VEIRHKVKNKGNFLAQAFTKIKREEKEMWHIPCFGEALLIEQGPNVVNNILCFTEVTTDLF
jgi:hypothetical protein